jgi:hypothetical protein
MTQRQQRIFNLISGGVVLVALTVAVVLVFIGGWPRKRIAMLLTDLEQRQERDAK